MPVQGLTAFYLLDRHPVAGKTVLVNAAAGGVGSLLVQLARRAGARSVIGTARSPKKLETVRALGADAAVDYCTEDWGNAVKAATPDGIGPDLVFDSVGGDVKDKSLAILAPHGSLVLYGALSITDSIASDQIVSLVFGNQSVAGFALPSLLQEDPDRVGRALAALLAGVAGGWLTELTEAVFPLEEAAEAHWAMEERRTIGKVWLRVSPDVDDAEERE